MPLAGKFLAKVANAGILGRLDHCLFKRVNHAVGGCGVPRFRAFDRERSGLRISPQHARHACFIRAARIVTTVGPIRSSGAFRLAIVANALLPRTARCRAHPRNGRDTAT